MGARAVLTSLCLALAVQHSLAALAIQRPEGDCIFPAVNRVNSANYFPPGTNAQIRSITPVVTDALSTTVTIAEDFSVQYFGTYKVVINKRVNESYVLYQCGTPNPLELPADTVPGLPARAKAFQIPLVSITAADTTVNGFLNELGLLNRVAFASSFSINSCMQALANTCGFTAADSYSSNASALAAQNAQVDAVFTFSKSNDSNSVAFSATLDPGTLDRAEWIKFVAAFFNAEPLANRVFDNITTTYNQLKTSANAANANAAKPVVAWMYALNTSIPFGYSWAGPAIIFSMPAYKNQYIQDAGGVPLSRPTLLANYDRRVVTTEVTTYSTRAENVLLNVSADAAAAKAALLDILKNVDVIIDETFRPPTVTTRDMLLKAYGISAAEAATLPAFANNRVYTTNGVVSASGTDWFERVVARPDLVLANLVAAINPSLAATTNTSPESKWLLPVGQQPTLLSSNSCGALQGCKRTAPSPILPPSMVVEPRNGAAAGRGAGAVLLGAAAAAAAALLVL